MSQTKSAAAVTFLSRDEASVRKALFRWVRISDSEKWKRNDGSQPPACLLDCEWRHNFPASS